MPLVKMPFRPYFNEQFKIQVNTPEEQQVCETFSDASNDETLEELNYLKKVVEADPSMAKEPFYIFTHTVVYARFRATYISAMMGNLQGIVNETRKRKERLAANQENPVAYQHPLVGPAPVAGRGFLASFFDSIMTDRMAYNKMEKDGVDFAQAKAESTVLWDVTMGRR